MVDKAPVSVCLIVKNEELQIENCINSFKDYVEEICVIDTGSTDRTPEIVKPLVDKFEVFTDCNYDDGTIKNFSLARQKSFSLATKPWIMWIDGDDVVQGIDKLNSVISRYCHLSDPVSIMFPYDYTYDSNGNVVCAQYRERLINNKEAFYWKGPIHEVLTSDTPGAKTIKNDSLKFIHKRQESNKPASTGRNLRILKDYYNEIGESDPRQLYYLGLEYGYSGDYGSSIRFHKRYIELSGWEEEKYLSCIKVSELYQGIGLYEDSIDWAFKAISMIENRYEAYFSLGRSYYHLAFKGGPFEKRNWERSVFFIKHGLSLPDVSSILFLNPIEKLYDIHKYYNLALSKTGDVKGAIDSAKAGLRVVPSDENLKTNLEVYERYLSVSEIERNLSVLEMKGIINSNDKSSISSIMNGNSPKKSETTEKALTIEKKKPDNLNLVFYVGPGLEPWNPEIAAKTGIGGSETAVIEMSKRLSKLGYDVTVYGDCAELEGVFDFVKYVDYRNFDNVECDMLISSRRPMIFNDHSKYSAKATMCWVHDVHLGGSFNYTTSLKIDKILTLSQWHKDFFTRTYPFLHENQVLVTRNGISLERFDKSISRNPHRAVYSSSPDRGLDVAVRAWPKIRSQVPDAELHIYYGFKNWEASTNDPGQLKLISYLKKLIKDHEKFGVHFHDRIPQDELAIEFLKSGVWAYSSWFAETSCQLAGTLIFTKNGMKPIECIAVGDEVLTHKGRFMPVTKLIKKHYSGDLYSIKRKKDAHPIVLTEEHPLYAVNFHKNVSSKGKRIYSHENVNYRWSTPNKLKPNTDYLMTPKMASGFRTSVLMSDYVDMPVMDGFICRNKNNPVYKSVKNEVILDKEMMFLLGLFAADGHAGWNAKRNAPGAITYSFHLREMDTAKRVQKFFGGKIRKISENGIVLTSYNAPWCIFLRSSIGVGRGKRIPPFVWECSYDLQAAFVEGMFFGDGHTNTNPKGNGKTKKPFMVYTSVSPSLTYGIAQLLTNTGTFPSINYSASRDAYTLTWSNNTRSPWHQEIEDGYVTRVQSVETSHYEGLVYNFEVDEDRSYVTNRTIVHNCISAMEAQAAGLRIVTSPIAALNETVGPRGKMISGDWQSHEYMEAWSQAVIDSMLDTDESDRYRNIAYAKENFGWDSLAKEWDSLIKNTIEEVSINVVPPYKVII